MDQLTSARSRNHSTDTLRTRRSHRSPSREKRDRRKDDDRRRHDRAYRDRDRSHDRHRDRDRDRRRDPEPRHRGDRRDGGDRHRDRDRDRERDRDSDRRRKRDDDDMDGRDSKRKKSEDPPPPPGALPPLPRDSPRRKDRSPDSRNGRRDDRGGRRMSSPLPPPIKRPSPTYEPPPQEDYNPDEPKEDDSEARSVFVSQLAARLTARDLGYFFEEKLGEGTVMDSRIVTDRMSRRSKGIAYVEFRSVDLVEKAIDLTGTNVMGRPIHIQLTESERNKLHPGDGNLNLPPGVTAPHGGAMQLYVGSLHFNLTESDIKQVFEPFGDLEFVDLHKDPTTGRSKGYAFVQYKRGEDAKMALEQMEGFELAGRTLRVNTVHEKGTARYVQSETLDDSGGGNLNAASRQALMQKLARIEPAHQPEPISRPNIPKSMESRSVLLKNMFNPEEETEVDWDKDLADDVKGECQEKYGKVDAIKVEKETQGEIYVKFDTIESAKKAIQGLNGRWFGGNQVSAAFISDAIMQAHQ
ncbi:hypothetical protein B0H16DRAFT_1657636 [Mycena metata]|uniref:RRM domain-containing protein n=1 Tax=Mycena metata TaxID=1033252 RepID=A0AAD7KI98_9AGAR|nr:hypothetical protein B0H16DRAFT_1657636 [Mycena metata]